MKGDDDSIFTNLSFKWRMILGMLICLCAMFIVMIFCFLFGKKSMNNEFDDLRKEVKELEKKNKILFEERNNKSNQLKVVINEELKLRNVSIDQEKRIKQINKQITDQNAELPKLLWTDIYWFLGFAPSAGLGGYLTKLAISKYYEVQELVTNNTMLKNKLIEIGQKYKDLNEQYLHYYRSFNETYSSLIETMVIKSMNGTYNLSEIFTAVKSSTNPEIDFYGLRKATENANDTATILITEKGWVIAVFLRSSLQEGKCTNDPGASLFSVNRDGRTIIKSDQINCAAFLSIRDKILKFGTEDIVIHSTFNGTTKANSSYQPLNQSIPVEEFYAGSPNFSLKSIHVYQFKWISARNDAHN